MKKINKLLILPATALIATTPIVAGCSCNKTEDTKYKNVMITSKPTKLNYLAGEKLDLTGLVVTGILKDYSSVELKSDEYTSSIADGTVLSTVGTNKITIATKEQNFVCEFDIVVNKSKITNFAITHEADKWIYNSGDRLDLTGLEVTGTYSDGTTKVLSKEEYATFPEDGSKVYEGDKLTKNFYVYDPNDLTSYVQSEIMVTSAAKNFEDTDWSEIIKWVGYHYDPQGIENFDELFCQHFKKTYLTDFVGLSHAIAISGQTYYVTIVDVNHDTIATGTYATKKALFTFRLNEVITDTNNEIRELKWNNSDNNQHYTTSPIRNNVISVASEIEDAVQVALKTVTKQTLEYSSSSSSYELVTYQDNMFLPTTTELGVASYTGGEQYDYLDSTPVRIVKKINNTDAMHYWTSTPNVSDSRYVCYIGLDGILYKEHFATAKNPIAPFFCI